MSAFGSECCLLHVDSFTPGHSGTIGRILQIPPTALIQYPNMHHAALCTCSTHQQILLLHAVSKAILFVWMYTTKRNVVSFPAKHPANDICIWAVSCTRNSTRSRRNMASEAEQNASPHIRFRGESWKPSVAGPSISEAQMPQEACEKIQSCCIHGVSDSARQRQWWMSIPLYFSVSQILWTLWSKSK